MVSSVKDIKKDFFRDGTREGELAPIVVRNGKWYVPTSDGVKEEVIRDRNSERDEKRKNG